MRYGYGLTYGLVLLALVGLGLTVRAQDQITFAFRPPKDGITLIQTEKATETKTQEFQGEKQTETTVTVNTIEQKFATVGTGFRYTETILSTEKMRDGKKDALEPIDQAFLKMPVVIMLDADGRVQSIRGLDAIRTKALNLMDGDERTLFQRLLTVEKMEAMGKVGWEAARKAFLGAARKPGESWSVRINDTCFSTQVMPVTAQITLKEIGTVNGRPSALVQTVVTPAKAAITKDLRTLMMDELEMFPPEANPTFRVLTYTTEAQDCIDAVLLTSLKALEKRTRKFQITAMGATLTITEYREAVTTTKVAD